MSLNKKLDKVLERESYLTEILSCATGHNDEIVKISKELADLRECSDLINKLRKAENELNDLKVLLSDDDPDIRDMAELDKKNLSEFIINCEKKIKIALLPKDELDAKNAIIEIRAGTGGDEAGLFAADLLRMYQKYAEVQNWKFEILYEHESEIGSIREAAASISGKGVFAKLRFESGVHRVQRVPVTESSGRVHTSTATVAVLPEAEEVDVKIEDKDLKIDVMRASGAGGQHVNKTESAVRITHIPTGIVVVQQDERSQHMNRTKAMKILMARIYERERNEKHDVRANQRKSQIGSGERSERIRTYNFPQGRVSDHRINLTLYKINDIMQGIGLVEIIDALSEAYVEEQLLECSQDE